jgi:hypothetical protein
MKPPRQSSNLTSDWQAERAAKLHRACLSVQAAVQRGEKLGRSLYRVSRRLNGQPYKCDPSRRVALSAITMRRIWDVWRRGGEVPAALRLNYSFANRIVYAPLLIRFVNFCADRDLKNFKAAWAALGQREAGLKISYDTLRRNLPTGCFKEFHRCKQAIRQAQFEIGKLRVRFAAEIQQHWPQKPVHRHRQRKSDFQI